MRDFKTIQGILGTLPEIDKLYLMGSTGAGKTSLVRHIIGTTKYAFPTTTQRRTTVAPTEYVIKKDLRFKTTIILKQKADIVAAIEDLVQEAIQKALAEKTTVEDVIYELEQSSDERFKLKHIVSAETFKAQADYLLKDIMPLLQGFKPDDETLYSNTHVSSGISRVVDALMAEIEINFKRLCGDDYPLFSDEPLIISGIDNKEAFILKNKQWLRHDFGSISVLVEYIRIEGNLLADWLDPALSFVLIDGEGIGHSLSEKRASLSTRHYDYFNFCHQIILLGDAEEPFATGGQGAIAGIVLNGYQDKLKLAFSKVDKLEHSDINGYLRRNINNLKAALKKEDITFSIENKDTYKLDNLNKPVTGEAAAREIKKLLAGIGDAKELKLVPLSYDFNRFFADFDPEKLITNIQSRINSEHWAVVKAFSKRMLWREIEYRHLKPLSWLQEFIMREINVFLKREDELQSEIGDSQNHIKQQFSQKLNRTLYQEFVVEKNHLWQQAFEKSGRGSDKERKQFIFNHILRAFLSAKKDDAPVFGHFSRKMQSLLIASGATVLMQPKRITISKVSIKKIFGHKDVEWSLGDDINILIGKNGSGKSTILKLIVACIKNDTDILSYFEHPYIELTLLKDYEKGESQSSTITSSSKASADIDIVMIDTFDIRSDAGDRQTDLDGKLTKLVKQFGQYQRSLTLYINKKTADLTLESKKIVENISAASPQDLIKFQQLSIDINAITAQESQPLLEFTRIIDEYFAQTNKTLITDNIKEPLLIGIKTANGLSEIKPTQLSSGEKQLLIIFLTVMLQQSESFILLMDEPETSLHVEWQSSFIDKIKQIAPDIQIIAATHNPLILLNRDQGEIGSIEINNDVVQTGSNGSKYLDISAILLDYFGLSSLIGADMQRDIKTFTTLKLKEPNLDEDEKTELTRLKKLLETSFAGDIIYDEKYFTFLKYLKQHKNIDFEQYEKIAPAEMGQFLNDFGDFFND